MRRRRRLPVPRIERIHRTTQMKLLNRYVLLSVLFFAIFVISVTPVLHLRVDEGAIPPLEIGPLFAMPDEEVARLYDERFYRELPVGELRPESRLLTWTPIVTSLISALGTIMTVSLGLKSSRHNRREQELRIAELELKLGLEKKRTGSSTRQGKR